jgi:hypothetical protein
VKLKVALMAVIVLLIGVLAAIFGLVGVINPNATRYLATRFRGPVGMYTAVVSRITAGSLLIWAGPACHPEMPWIGWSVRLIGAISIAAALCLLLMGLAKYQAFIDWSIRQSPLFLRGVSLAALMVGVFLIYDGY